MFVPLVLNQDIFDPKSTRTTEELLFVSKQTSRILKDWFTGYTKRREDEKTLGEVCISLMQPS
jgi:hypothetical protein